ncbi:XkdX family protein [Lactobacillus helveticus]|uniref:XkdX family protein n=1 Tax=Lactobacillus helveticus TaxID=1587 RepID=UPI000D7BB742|nr:XkdX family protein [Lactobacillus helveticus]PXZ24295.1 XkdX family protein [Lactobacillus helveticus]PXZ27619.1 XkdX family protein [Lactobacillus helveticus]PXZ31422.1 XkdX family protein [Lactobacillus helveticus]PXZ36197.1 XkdX family protein [Lactobacillus helveticus]PXZ37771.1 XkdX family protein [Lactobacillus helveticus]
MSLMDQIQANFLEMYRMDWEFGIYDKDDMKGLVVQGFLSPENYAKIVGEAYVASQAQPQPASQA